MGVKETRKGTDMATRPEAQLSRRERQIMDIIYAKERASVSDVRKAMSDAPSYSAVRALMRILEEKGHLKHTAEGNRYIYHPTRDRKAASRSALKRVLKTFFNGSAEQALAALLETKAGATPEELKRMSKLIDQARKEGR
jgi:predicted transcriptional regulator